VVFSLAAENNEYRTNRVRILFGASISAVVIAALLVVLSRYQIVRPLRRLAYAAGRLEQGDMSARAGIASDDEIGALSRAFDTMGCAVADRHQRLAQEVEIAERIQTSILPRRLEVASLDISAAMVPASEVGGDYYDVLRTTDGCWLGVGDVSGHGLNAGLVMLMMQSMVSVLTKERPDAAPREIVSTLNRALFDSVRERLDMEHHATLTLLRYRRDGRVVFAGAHEEVIVWRAATKRCELFETPGTWVAGVRDVADATIDTALVLDAGDVMVLHTDGVTEARNSDGRMFGIERLCSEIERAESTSAASIQGHLIDAVKKWTHVQHDDITILVAKYQPNAP
jgi:sigma-B regulation protein RsbU (phosphoserine phosphatase)